VGFGRKIARPCAAIALLGYGVANAAEPAEPLTLTRLPDSESQLLVPTDSSVPAAKVDEFGEAVSQAVRAQRQSIEARCQSVPTASSPVAARWAWEARCRYKRY